jgi:cob(I)alamin adenosyltransferase
MAGTVHRGDGGETQLGSGQRVGKDDPRIECLGSIDELSSFLGLARSVLLAEEGEPGRPQVRELAARLARIQRELYLLGAELGRRDVGEGSTASRITAEHVHVLDRAIDEVDAGLPKLRAFILPGGGVVATHLHVARAVCRRAERHAVRVASTERVGSQVLPYLNRLSLALFSMARLATHLAGAQDEPA